MIGVIISAVLAIAASVITFAQSTRALDATQTEQINAMRERAADNKLRIDRIDGKLDTILDELRKLQK